MGKYLYSMIWQSGCQWAIWRGDLGKGGERVRADAVLHEFKVEMVSCAVTCTAYIADNLSCRYRFTCGNGSLCHVGIACRQPSSVVQQDLVAIAAGNDDRAAVGGQDRCAIRCWNIGATVARIAESVGLPKLTGNIGVAGQRPLQRTIADNTAASRRAASAARQQC